MWFNPAEYQKSNLSGVATLATTATKTPENPDLSQKSRMSQPVTVSIDDYETPKNVAIVANVATGLSAGSREKLLAYLDAIGETDQASIDEYLAECGKDAENLARELQQADDCLQIKTGDYTGLVQCLGCSHLSGDTCNRYGWRVVVDKWRRCPDFDVLQKTPDSSLITCKACSHFQSFNEHGGGAGACDAGVMPFGACHWADTRHQCEKYQVLEVEK